MKWPTSQPRRLALFAALLILAIAPGCQPKTSPLTAQEQQTVSELTQDLKPYCFGRFLIDLPKQAIVSQTGPTVGHNRDVVIETMGSMTQDEFNARMAQIEKEYKEKKHRRGWPYFYGSSSPIPTIKLFERLEDAINLTYVSRSIEGFKWSNNTLIKMVVKAHDVSDPESRADSILKQLTTNTPQKKALLTDLLQRVRARAASEIPTEPGLCFEGGFLAGKASEEEEFSATISFAKMPDVTMNFNSNTENREPTTLLDRASAIEKSLPQRNGKTLRKGKLTLMGIPQAEEWLLAGEMGQSGGGKMQGHEFTIEGNSKISSPQTPFFTFEFKNGNGYALPEGKQITKASLSDAEALALWDAVSKTIRMRSSAL